MAAPETTIDVLLPWLVERTKSDPFFTGVEVTHEDDSDFLNKLEQALAVLGGTAVVWMGPKGLDKCQNYLLGPMDLQITATILQNPVLMSTPQSARSYARRVRDLCKHVAAPGLCSGLIPLERCIERIDSDIAPVAYTVQFSTKEADMGNTRVEYVGVSVQGSVATLTCATAGAEIWLSPESSFPRNGATGAFLYTAPINLTESLQFCAYKTGLIPSLVGLIKVTTP